MDTSLRLVKPRTLLALTLTAWSLCGLSSRVRIGLSLVGESESEKKPPKKLKIKKHVVI